MTPFWRKSRKPAATTYVRLKPSVDLSITALLYMGATLFIGVAAMNSQTNLLFGVFGLMVGVLLVAGYISKLSLRRLRVRRAMPEHLVVGESATLTYEISNQKRFWPSISVSLGELDGCEAFVRQPYSYLLHVAAAMSTAISEEIRPKRRGICELGRYQLSTSFPFGFIKRALTRSQPDTIVIYPAIARVDGRIVALFQSAEKAGSLVRPRKGGNDEFYGVKEYRTGENPRLIHWKRSARTGNLVVREMTQVAPPRLLLMVDTFEQDDSPEQAARVEHAIAMAASLASFALEQGHPVGLFVWSGNWMHISPNRGKRQRREMLAALARLQPNRNPDADIAALISMAMPHAGMGTTAVILTPQPSSGLNTQSPRRQFVLLSSSDGSATRWFTFPTHIDFAACAPFPADPPGRAPDSRGREPSPTPMTAPTLVPAPAAASVVSPVSTVASKPVEDAHV
jgi:uncharacterized protein (DUF58 family)